MDFDNLIIDEEKEIIEAMKKIDFSGVGIAIAINKSGGVTGTISDGDIRKSIINGADIKKEKIKDIMRRDPILIKERDIEDRNIINLQIRQLLERSPRGGFVPVINEYGKIMDLLHFSEPKRESYIDLKKKNNDPPLVRNVGQVLVVGGAGYLGSVLIRKLLERGYRTKILDLFMFGKESVEEVKNNPNLEVIEGDVRDITTISKALNNVDAVIHLAAIVGDPASKSRPLDTIETNFLATKILSEACEYRQINRFIYASTCSVYGKGDEMLTEESPLNPISHYARTKIKSEQGILNISDSNFSPCILRMGTLYGLSPRMRFDLVANIFAMKAITEKKITVFGGEQWRPMLHVDDAAESYIKCLESPINVVKGQVFNVGTESENYKIGEIGRIVKSVIPETEIEITDKEIIRGQQDDRDYKVSFKKIRDALGFNPKKRIKDGIIEIKNSIENGSLSDFKNPKYYNLVERI